MKYKTYLVGGAVRDEILGISSKDLDYVMLAPSFEAMKETLIEGGCKIFFETPEFLTIRAKHPILGSVDFACGRKDGEYSDGRHPEDVALTMDLIQDLARRDFTCNAMAMDVDTGEIIDPFNSLHDIKEKKLRAVGNATKRLEEDKLRAFRAIRFEVTKGFFIHITLNEAINGLVYTSQFQNVSTERIREELIKMFGVDWSYSFYLLNTAFPTLGKVVKERNIKFKPC